MIDFIEENKHRQYYLIEDYERQLDDLRYSVDELRNGKSIIEVKLKIPRVTLRCSGDSWKGLGTRSMSSLMRGRRRGRASTRPYGTTRRRTIK